MITSACLLLSSPVARAENGEFVLVFGGEPGAPLAHAYDYGVPPADAASFTLRVPLVDTAIKTIFVDAELTVLRENKLVQRVHAERAYQTLGYCNDARAQVEAKLARLLPAPYTGAEAAWQHRSADGRIAGGAVCRLERWLPFPILTLDLSLQ